MLGVSLLVIIVAQESSSSKCETGLCERDTLAAAFEQAARRALGNDAKIQTEIVATDPADEDSSARPGVDGVVELSFTPEGNKARIHCYVSKEQRWLDREISFGESRGSVRRETTERGRLLGFAVATMFTAETEPALEATPAAVAPPPPVTAASGPARAVTQSRERPASERSEEKGRSIEFAGIVSSGLDGNAGGLGASAGLRLALTGPVWARLFVAGRAGNIPRAQASTRTALMGGGFALALLPQAKPIELGARVDLFASYFEASHLSEDDLEADRRTRWQAGADFVAEAGLRLTGGAGVLLGLGIEGIAGKTEIYTHGNRVAVVPPFRAIAEVGFRTRF